MWAQEGRLCPVINAVKSPVGLHWPAGGVGCVRVFEHPGGLPTRASRRCWKVLARGELLQARWRNKWCGTTTISRQEGKGIWTKRWMERRSEIIGRGGYRWWEQGGEWLHFGAVVHLFYRRESLQNLDSPARDERGWQHSVTACLFLLPFWHKNRSPLTTVPVDLPVWDLKRLHGESGLKVTCSSSETTFFCSSVAGLFYKEKIPLRIRCEKPGSLVPCKKKKKKRQLP